MAKPWPVQGCCVCLGVPAERSLGIPEEALQGGIRAHTTVSSLCPHVPVTCIARRRGWVGGSNLGAHLSPEQVTSGPH